MDAHLSHWTGPQVTAECRTAHNAYKAAKTESYRAYFTAYPHLKAVDHAYKAVDLAAALPDDWAGLADQLPATERHRQHLSGNSSQVLALGLLGASAKLDPSLNWLWDALGPLPPATDPFPSASFEYKLAPEVLDERPRQTSVDFYVDDPSVLLCMEAKWTEAGIGACGCGAAAALIGDCSDKVRGRQSYWETLTKVFNLPARKDGEPCPLSFTYQAVRNAAAALALAKPGQQAVFALLYDDANPYFAGCGNWPGWPAALCATLSENETDVPVVFAAVSWQELLPMLPLDAGVASWASDKHGLHPS